MSIANELLCAREIGRALFRNPWKYWPLLPLLYGSTLADRKVAQAARYGYAFMRHLDDVVDRDLHVSDTALYVQSIQLAMLNGKGGPPIMYLFENLRERINDPAQYFGPLVEALLFDRERTIARRALTESELRAHEARTFTPLVNLMFAILDSSIRADSVPILVTGQATWYRLRDFREDWTRGTINVPAEVLDSAGLSSACGVDIVVAHPLVHEWLSAELPASKKAFVQLAEDYKNHPEPFPRLILQFASWYFRCVIPDLTSPQQQGLYGRLRQNP